MHTRSPRFLVCAQLEILDGAFHINGEPVRLMGVERTAGSNPELVRQNRRSGSHVTTRT